MGPLSTPQHVPKPGGPWSELLCPLAAQPPSASHPDTQSQHRLLVTMENREEDLEASERSFCAPSHAQPVLLLGCSFMLPLAGAAELMA